jgi:acetoin utilization deacetylase AcuC-like enzyme
MTDRRAFLKSSAAALVAGLAGRVPAAGAKERTSLPTALVYDDFYQRHDSGEGHPESPRRVKMVIDALRGANFGERLKAVDPRAAQEADLLRCHTDDYVRTAKRDIASGAGRLSTGDTVVGEKSLDVALLAAGGVMAAVDAVVDGKAHNAFCVVRPPGHHATPKRGMGFCVFNNVAVAARYAQHRHKVGKVLIVDWDVHHGNGTQDVFYQDGSVLFFSTHQSPWYPGTGRADETGAGKGLGLTINCPLPAGTERKEVFAAFTDKLLPAAAKFKPEMVFLSAGFDSREGDPLGQFRLTDADFADLTKMVLRVAKAHAGGRLVSVLEGGYNLEGLASASVAHVQTLCGAGA